MKLTLASFIFLSVPAVAQVDLKVDSGQLSPEWFDYFNHHDYIPPDFKVAIHALVDNNAELASTQADNLRLQEALPEAKRKADEAEAKLAKLQAQLTIYSNLAESDFTELQKTVSDPKAKITDQYAVVQAYVWTYPSSPHLAAVQQALASIQKKLADETQAKKDKQAADLAAQQKLIQRAISHDLSLSEWQDFMRDRSQSELVTLIGRPSIDDGDDWIYRGDWATDPKGGPKIGLQVFFNAGRVQTVTAAPAPTP